MYGVLIVDDEPWSREVVISLGRWEDLGLEVVGCSGSGEEAVAEIRRLSPRIVVTDMRMGGMDGPALLEAIERVRPPIYAIVASGYDDYRYLRQALRSGAVEYLLKPIDPEDLNAALARCVRRLDKEGAAEAAPRSDPSFILESPSRLERYMDLRGLIRESVGLLDREGAAARFRELELLLEDAPGVNPRGDAAMVVRDFLLGLEELRLSGGAAGRAADSTLVAAPIEAASPAEAARAVASLYLGLIDAALAARKAQGRIDVGEVRSYLERHYREGLSLEALARRFFVSREHLCRSFKAATGEGIVDFTTRLRMEEARMLIEERGSAIKDVAEAVGYSDLGYFYRVFKRVHGKTPGEVRKDQ